MIDKLLYIDPGTGSMLFSIVIGIAGVLVFALRGLWIKLKFVLTGGRSKAEDSNTMPICIFSEGKRYWNVFSPICDEFEKRQKDIWYLTASPDDPALSAEYKYVHAKFIGEGNKALSKMNLINADIVLSTTPGLDVYQWKRSKGVKWYVHIPHMPNDVTIYRMFGLDFYDAIIMSGQYQIDEVRRLEKIRGIPAKDLKLVGVPYLDLMKARLDNTPKREANKENPVVLLAPTWGKSAILSLYGASFIESLIKTGYRIIVRPHPQSFISEKEMMDELLAKFPENDKFHWSREPDNFNVLNESDILISDFSGVVFDYSLVFNKPFIYTDPKFDPTPFDCSWDDVETWTFTTIPKIGRKLTQDNFENIGELIDDCLNGTGAEDLENARRIAREETWCNIGEGAVHVTDYLLAKYDELKTPKQTSASKSKNQKNKKKSK